MLESKSHRSGRQHPEGRPVDDLGHQSRADHDETGEEHDEDGGPVARIGEAVIEPPDIATLTCEAILFPVCSMLQLSNRFFQRARYG